MLFTVMSLISAEATTVASGTQVLPKDSTARLVDTPHPSAGIRDATITVESTLPRPTDVTTMDIKTHMMNLADVAPETIFHKKIETFKADNIEKIKADGQCEFFGVFVYSDIPVFQVLMNYNQDTDEYLMVAEGITEEASGYFNIRLDIFEEDALKNNGQYAKALITGEVDGDEFSIKDGKVYFKNSEKAAEYVNSIHFLEKLIAEANSFELHQLSQ